MITQQARVDMLDAIRKNIDKSSCIVGFDAFVDHITRHVRKRDAENVVYFETLKEYAEFLMRKDEMSGSIEMIELAKKHGGNNPILSYALGKAGAKVVSIGAYGTDGIHPIFSDIQKHCSLYSFTAPGECWAYEFSRNKIMSYINMNGEDFTYRKVLDCVGDGELTELIEQSELMVLVNYSEQTKVINIWRGLLENALPRVKTPKKFFFDLSDCTRISDRSIQDCVDVLSEFGNFGKVYLSLNENEFAKLCALYLPGECEDCGSLRKDAVPDCLKKLRQSISADYIILRTFNDFYAVGDADAVSVPNIIEENPLYLTGVGDNQNAGICLGLMCDLSISDSLTLGVLYGNHYIRNGSGAGLEEILA